MDNFNINTFEKSKLEFANFVTNFFQDNKDIFSFSLILRRSQFFYKGIGKDLQTYLDIICLEVQNNHLTKKYIPNNGFDNNNEKFAKVLNMLSLEKNNNKNIDYENILSIIKEQSLFNYSNELFDLKDQTRWNFTRDNINDDINNFIGRDLLKKQMAIYLSKTLSLPIKSEEDKTKI